MLSVPSNCTGCSACVSICPKGCIKQGTDKEGFVIPMVNTQNCIECHLCEKVCPAINLGQPDLNFKVLAGQCNDKEILQQSSSGGIFSIIAKKWLENKDSAVYGAAIDYEDDCKVKHIRIDSEADLYKLRGSKYVQSDMSEIFPKVAHDIKSRIRVLFSGTPCQIAGLKKYLRQPLDNLLCIDIICHGVPSPLAWQTYTQELLSDNKINHASNSGSINMQYESRIKRVNFRDKSHGWQNYGFCVTFKNLIENQKYDSQWYGRYENPFMKGFLADIFLRKSCYNCPVKGFSSGADITLGDAWGIEHFLST